MWFGKKIDQLQRKPYQVKTRVLWIATAAAALVLLLLWGLTVKLRDTPRSEGLSKFSEILENAKKVNTIGQ